MSAHFLLPETRAKELAQLRLPVRQLGLAPA
jgi:hypothetical protein